MIFIYIKCRFYYWFEFRLQELHGYITTFNEISNKQIQITMTITTSELDNIQVGLYKNARTTKRSDIIRLIEFLLPLQNYDKVKDVVLELRSIEDKEKQKEYKMNNLIGATLSGLFGETRNANNVIQLNNIMCVDVDEADNEELFAKYDIEDIKRIIFEFNFVYCVCLSCRGKGFYFIVPIPDAKDIDVYYTSMYYKLKRYGINIDKHCKDVSRIRFCSYDDNILIKRDCEIEVFDEVSEEQINEKRMELERANRIIKQKRDYTYNEQIQYLNKTIDYLISKGFDTGEHWSEWATIGKYLKTIGEEGRIMFHRLSEVSRGYKGFDDVEKNWKRFNTCQSEDEAMGKFYTMVRNKYGENWRKEMQQFELTQNKLSNTNNICV